MARQPDLPDGLPDDAEAPSVQRDPIVAAAPRPNERILLVRNALMPSVVSFAKLHPDAHFVSLEPNEASFSAARREIEALGIVNVELSPIGEPQLLPVADALFDKVLLLMNLHTAMPEPRLTAAREMLRVRRRKGVVFAADLDVTARHHRGHHMGRGHHRGHHMMRHGHHHRHMHRHRGY